MTKSKPDLVLICYIPVVHQGYIDFLHKFKGAALFIVDYSLLEQFGSPKEIRTVDPKLTVSMVAALKIFSEVTLLTAQNIAKVKGKNLVLPDEVLSHKLAEKYFTDKKVIYEKVFLRWEEGSVKRAHNVKFDRVSNEQKDKDYIEQAYGEGEKSSDWWRHVGAVVIKDGQIVLRAHNQHLPTEDNQYIDGDPRDFFAAGVMGEISGAIHAEEALVGAAARQGINLSGARVYMNVFPCLRCARTLVAAGIKAIYFQTGNAYLNVEEEFRAAGVEIIFVES